MSKAGCAYIIRLVNLEYTLEGISPKEGVAIQRELAGQVITTGRIAHVKYVAGVDVSFPIGSGEGTAAVVVMSYPGMEIVEIARKTSPVRLPYIPGLLSFRELPIILEAFSSLSVEPDLTIVDGQGRAHPRRLGIACHLGLHLDKPVIGCAKSRLCGEYSEPDTIKGSKSPLLHKGEVIGTVLRTRQNVRPVFVSAGHRISLRSSEEWILKMCHKYRLPEPVRMAHMSAGGLLSYRQ